MEEAPIAGGDRWVCVNCGYIYDPAEGDPGREIPPGTRFEDLPASWRCPVCYVTKDEFDPL